MFTGFGLAKDFTSSEELASSTEGYTPKTPMYCSPEVHSEGARNPWINEDLRHTNIDGSTDLNGEHVCTSKHFL
jgi:hypothetical protein